MAKNTSKQKDCNEMRHKKLDLNEKMQSYASLKGSSLMHSYRQSCKMMRKRKLVNAFINALVQNDANNKTIHKLHKLIFT